MSGEAVTEAPPSGMPQRRQVFYGLLALLALAGFGYFTLIENEDSSANYDFYRILYEASNDFNESLVKLDRLLQSYKSQSTIVAMFPSYTQIEDKRWKADDTERIRDYHYQLNGKNLEITVENLATGLFTSENFEARLHLEDILPQPKQGFSRYLFAGGGRKVLAAVGGEKTISMVDLSSIGRAIQEKKRPMGFDLQEVKSPEQQQDGLLPSHGSHVDMKLSYGEFRVFIFPFTLEKKIHSSEGKALEQLYLVGMLPKQQLAARGAGHWNISLLLVTLVSLLFMWNLLRLYLLPKNQSISTLYRRFTIASNYAFYIVLIALVLAFMQKTALRADKDQTAFNYARKLSQQLNDDLLQVFNGLAAYRPFYRSLLQELDDFPRVGIDKLSRSYSGRLEDRPVTDRFSSMVTRSLNTITSVPCDQIPEGLLPNYAWTTYKTYSISYKCQEGQDRPIWNLNTTLDKSVEQVLLNAYQKKSEGMPSLGFIAGNLSITREAGVGSYLGKGRENYLPSNILTVFAFNKAGKTILPTINYQENNAPPHILNLSHRDYYKKIRDHKGWRLCLAPHSRGQEQCLFNNVYIQRVLNINDGTRGTTISLPLLEEDGEGNSNIAASSLGADVILPSLSLAEPAPLDFSYMVVDRNSGDVLFHSDESRTLVENLFFSGNGKTNLSQAIKAGLDHYDNSSNKMIKGYYHGKEGRFALVPAPVEEWAVVVFYPDDSLDALMTNQFLFIAVSFAVSLLLLVSLLFICEHFICVRVLKRRWCIPATINGKMIMMAASVVLSTTYSLYSLGLLLDLSQLNRQWFGVFSLLVPILGLIVVLYAIVRICSRKYHFTGKGLRSLMLVASALAALHLSYLYLVAQAPLAGLGFHYQQLRCTWLNYERQEAINMALSRYPNSIIQQRIDPLSLLPLPYDLGNHPTSENSGCEEYSSQTDPEDYPSLSTLIGTARLWQWINTYLFKEDLPGTDPLASQYDLEFRLGFSLIFCMLLLSLIGGWLLFNRRFILARLYCPEQFLQHIARITKAESTLPYDQRSEKLTIECETVKLNGVGLATLLRLYSRCSEGSGEPELSDEYELSKHTLSDTLMPGFAQLFKQSPCLQQLSAGKVFLPNLKLDLEVDADRGLMKAKIWDIETCVERAEFRQHLLDLIMEIKSLTLAGRLEHFTIVAAFHSLQRVKIKDSFSVEEGHALEHAEYISWADCLMDFNVNVSESFAEGVNTKLLQQEAVDFPELYFLLPPESTSQQEDAEEPLLRNANEADVGSKWTTINYILLHAEALYRFKWESCSSTEKLALYNLAKGHKLNPTNTQMIEHLALNGLIKVEHGQLEIINKSFQHFVLSAETPETIGRLVNRSQAGMWKSYRLPLGLLVLLVIGGIALTSGESIYIIAASMAGVLGTIVSVTNSANILRGQFKK